MFYLPMHQSLLYLYGFMAAVLAVLPIDAFAEHAVISLAREFRVDAALPIEMERNRENEILAKVYEILPDYSCYETLESAAKSFLSDTLSIEMNDFAFIDIGQTPLRGRSKDSVYVVKDQNEDPLYVIKAFLHPRQATSGFLPEISALLLIEELSLSYVRAIMPLGFAKYCDGHQEWGLLLETAAQGKRLDEYILPLTISAIGAEERAVYIKAAQKAFVRMGQSLAELHNYKPKAPAVIPAINLDRYADRLFEILNNPFICNELSGSFCIQDFVKHVECIRNEVLLIPISYSYWHGDAHFGNMFYDEQKDDFYFVDVARMHRSVDFHCQPIQDGALDLQRIEESFRISALGGLTEEEYNSLLGVFYESYACEAGHLPDERVLNFYKSFMLLGRLIIYARYVDVKNETQQMVDKAIFESAIADFKNMIFGK